MLTFKHFLLEGGNATTHYGVSRATSGDIKSVLQALSKILSVPVETLENDLLGSTGLTYYGKRKDSGDIDIAFSLEHSDIKNINSKMLSACNNEGIYNSGTKVGSYAFPVGDKKVQVDLMFVKNKDWAKFIYHSEEGSGSQYAGVVRNIILMTALAYTQEINKDFVIRNDAGKAVVRASKSIVMSSGMSRLFKMVKINDKTGQYNKTITSVEPEDLEKHLQTIGKKFTFSHDLEYTDNPDDVSNFIFGASIKAKDIMTAEDVIKQINKLSNAVEIKAACRSELTRMDLPIPKEL